MTKIKLGNYIADLGDTSLSIVLTSPYPLMASGYQGGNFIFNFTLPATPELKKEYKHAHRPQASGIGELPFYIEASGLRYSGTAQLTEAGDDTYDVFCPVGNGDFNVAAKNTKLSEIDLGGDIVIQSGSMVEANTSQDYDFNSTGPEPFTIEQIIAFDNIILDNNEFNDQGTAFIADSNKSLTFIFKLDCFFQDSSNVIFKIFKNGTLNNSFYLGNEEQVITADLTVIQGDIITWQLHIVAIGGLYEYSIRGTFYSGSSIKISDSQAPQTILDGAIKRYPEVNYAVFPLENPYVFDKWADDFYQIDNESIKVLYSTIFKIINYWTNNNFPPVLIKTNNAVGNLFIPFPYIAFIVKQIAYKFNFAIANNVFEDALKYAVLINHYIENQFLSSDSKMLTPNDSFNLVNHVPDYTVYEFMQHIGSLFGLGYEVDNERSVIEFNFVDDIIKSVDSIDISDMVAELPRVQFDKKIDAFSLQQMMPAEDKYFSQVKSLTGLNMLGTVNTLGDLPVSAALNDCYFVVMVDAYMIWNYNPDAYVFSWIFHSRKFTSEIKSGEDPQTISSEICPLMSVIKYDALSTNDRVWTIPASHQPSRFESAPEMFQSEWKPGIAWYHGLKNDSNGNTYPFASSGITDHAGNLIPGAELALTLDGANSLYEKKWKTYLNWRITAKPVSAAIIPDHTFLRNLKFSRKVRFNGVRYLIAEARGNITKDGPDVWELSLLVDL